MAFVTSYLNESIAVADVNNDGKLDIIVPGAAATVLMNNGDGTFGQFSVIVWGSSLRCYSVAIEKLNADAEPDLALSCYYPWQVPPWGWQGHGEMVVLVNNGDGTFEQLGPRYFTNMWPGTNAEGSIAAADLNGDGAPDLAVANNGVESVNLFLNNGDGTFAPKVDYISGITSTSVAIAKINEDDAADLVVSVRTPVGVIVFLNNGNGSFAPKVHYPTIFGSWSVVAADLNGDAKTDVAVAGGAGMSVLLNACQP